MAKVEYNESMNAEILRLAKEGYLKCEIAAALGISTRQLLEWRRKYDDVRELLELADTYQAAWWCGRGRTNLENPRFNFYLWYSIMKNAHGWADKPTERNLDLQEWQGDLIKKINHLDDIMQTGKCSPDVYEKMMKSLNAHANINEIVYVQPKLALLELEAQLKRGEITEDTFMLKKAHIDKCNMIREMAAEAIFREENLYSNQHHTNIRKKPRLKREKKAEELENTEVEIKETIINPAFDEQAKKMHEARMQKLKIDDDCSCEDDEEHE